MWLFRKFIQNNLHIGQFFQDCPKEGREPVGPHTQQPFMASLEGRWHNLEISMLETHRETSLARGLITVPLQNSYPRLRAKWVNHVQVRLRWPPWPHPSGLWRVTGHQHISLNKLWLDIEDRWFSNTEDWIMWDINNKISKRIIALEWMKLPKADQRFWEGYGGNLTGGWRDGWRR